MTMRRLINLLPALGLVIAVPLAACSSGTPEKPSSSDDALNGKCIDDIVGSPGQGCNDDGLLKQKAADTCKLQGLDLTSISYADDCKVPGQSSYAKYECCDAQPPP